MIFLSALAEIADKIRGLELGAVDYITKPFDQGEVLARVRSQLKIQRLTSAVLRANRDLREQAGAPRRGSEGGRCIQRSLMPSAPPPIDNLRWRGGSCRAGGSAATCSTSARSARRARRVRHRRQRPRRAGRDGHRVALAVPLAAGRAPAAAADGRIRAGGPGRGAAPARGRVSDGALRQVLHHRLRADRSAQRPPPLQPRRAPAADPACAATGRSRCSTPADR